MMHGKVCVREQLKQKVMTESHSPLCVGHMDIDALIKVVEHYFYWPSLRKDVENFVRTCVTC